MHKMKCTVCGGRGLMKRGGHFVCADCNAKIPLENGKKRPGFAPDGSAAKWPGRQGNAEQSCAGVCTGEEAGKAFDRTEVLASDLSVYFYYDAKYGESFSFRLFEADRNKARFRKNESLRLIIEIDGQEYAAGVFRALQPAEELAPAIWDGRLLDGGISITVNHSTAIYCPFLDALRAGKLILCHVAAADGPVQQEPGESVKCSFQIDGSGFTEQEALLLAKYN